MALVILNSDYLDINESEWKNYLRELVISGKFRSSLYRMDQEELISEYMSGNFLPNDTAFLNAIESGAIAFVPIPVKIDLLGINPTYTLIYLLRTFIDGKIKTHRENGCLAIMACPEANVKPAGVPFYRNATELRQGLYPDMGNTRPARVLMSLKNSKKIIGLKELTVEDIIIAAENIVDKEKLSGIIHPQKNANYPSRSEISKAFIKKKITPPTANELNRIFGVKDMPQPEEE